MSSYAEDAVAEWLGKMILQEYTDTLAQNGYTSLDQCMTLTETDLDDIGVTKPGHRKRLLKGVLALKEDESNLLAGIALNAKDASAKSPPPRPKPPAVAPRGSSLTTKAVLGTGSPTPVQKKVPPVPMPRKSSLKIKNPGPAAKDDAGPPSSPPPAPPSKQPSTSDAARRPPATLPKVPPALPPVPPPAANPGPALPPRPMESNQKSFASAPSLGTLIRGTGMKVEESDDEDEGEYIPLPRPSALYDQAPVAPKKVKLMSKPISERTHEGYLSKKGGVTGKKGWDKRWFRLQNGAMRYYRTATSAKESGVIFVEDMIAVRPTPTVDSRGIYNHRFELDTPKRTYYFNAESVADMTEWMMLIGAVITEKQALTTTSVGGNMADPEKAGWVKIKQHDLMQTWKRHYVAIKEGIMCFYTCYDDYIAAKPCNNINLAMVSLKISRGGKMERNNQFQIVCAMDATYDCQAESQLEMKEIVKAINDGIMFAIELIPSEKKSSTDKIKGELVLEKLRASGQNSTCADCAAQNPDWASINLGVLVCMNCSGVHRSLGVHISKVRSVTLDEWNDTLIGIVDGIGNTKSNTFWEADLGTASRPTMNASMDERTVFINRKYKDMAFCNRKGQSTIGDLESNVMSPDLSKTVELVFSLASKPTNVEQGLVVNAAVSAGQAIQTELLALNGFEVPEELISTVSNVGPRGTVYLQDTFPKELELLVNGNWNEHSVQYELGQISFSPIGQPDVPPQTRAVGKMVKCEAEATSPTGFTIAFSDGRIDQWKAKTVEGANSWIDLISKAIAALPQQESVGASEFTKIGYMTKMDRTKGTMNRPKFFCLRLHRLEFYRNEGDPMQGSIDLLKVASITPISTAEEASDGGPAWFSIMEANQEMTLVANSFEEMMSWVDALNAAKDRHYSEEERLYSDPDYDEP